MAKETETDKQAQTSMQSSAAQLLRPLAAAYVRKKLPKLKAKGAKLLKKLTVPLLILALLLILFPGARQAAQTVWLYAESGIYRIAEALGIPVQSSIPESFDYSAVPAYSGSPWVTVNNGVPFFTAEEKEREERITPGELDLMGRCTEAVACLSRDSLPDPELERERLYTIPTGWKQNSYTCIDDGDFVTGDPGYLYNRSHLLAFCLTGLQDEPKNLITGTRYMNVDGMLPWETKVLSYLYSHPRNHVMYRVTPIFGGVNQLADGVLMEAWSVEDRGGLRFCVFAYNVQPGIFINYLTGDNSYSGIFLDKSASSVILPAA